MKKTIFTRFPISTLILLLFVLVSCTQQSGQRSGNLQKAAENISGEILEETAELPSGECEPHWGCISSSTKAYQTEDCSWIERKECPLGCFNGTCRQGNTCEPGFKCKDENTKGYQTEVCHWSNEKECPWGCSERECNPKPENYTENQTAEDEDETGEEEAAAPQKNIKLLDTGDTHTIAYEGLDYELSVYLIEEERTKLKLGEQKSDWLEENSTFTHSSGLKVTVESVFFQAYQGGKKAVEYTIG